MTEGIFVDKDHSVFVGPAAEKKLREESDKCYFEETERGVTRVPPERWEIAQTYEKKTWMEMGISATNDRNLNYMLAFNRYKDLKGLKFEHAIELGCGPFTNLRLLSWPCRIEHCSLLDPLADVYLEHPNCFYSRKFLYRDWRFLMPKIVNSRLGSVLYKMIIPKRVYGQIPIEQIIAKPIEEMSVQTKYDLIVIMNVLEHCYDANLIFEKIASIAKKDTYLVFREPYYDYAHIVENIGAVYDAGHPLRIEKELVDDFLGTFFLPVFRSIQKLDFSVGGINHHYNTINFIGKARAR